MAFREIQGRWQSSQDFHHSQGLNPWRDNGQVEFVGRHTDFAVGDVRRIEQDVLTFPWLIARGVFQVPTNFQSDSFNQLTLRLRATWENNKYGCIRIHGAFAILTKTDIKSALDVMGDLDIYNYVRSEVYASPSKQHIVTESFENDEAYLVFENLDTLNIRPGDTLYVYIRPKIINNDLQRSFENVEIYWADEGATLSFKTNTELDAPLDPKLYVIDSGTNGRVRIKWTPVSDKGDLRISGYRIYYNSTKTINLNQYVDTNTLNPQNPKAATADVKSHYPKNTTVFFWIRTNANTSSGHSIPIFVGSYNVTDTLPSAPTFEIIGGVKEDGSSSTILIKNLKAFDPDTNEGTMGFEYEVTDSPSLSREPIHVITGNSFQFTATKNKRFLHIAAGTYVPGEGTLVRVGPIATKEIPLNIPIVINDIHYSSNYQYNFENTKSATALSASASLNKEANSYRWEISTYSSNFQVVSTKSTFSNIDVLAHGGLPNELIYINLTVTDSFGNTATKMTKTDLFTPPALSLPTLQVERIDQPLVPGISERSVGKRLRVTSQIPSITGKGVRLKSGKISIEGIYQTYQTFDLSPTAGQNLEKEITLSVPFGQSFNVFLEIEDQLGQIIRKRSSTTYTRANVYTLSKQGAYEILPKNWCIYNTDGSSKFSVSCYLPNNIQGIYEIQCKRAEYSDSYYATFLKFYSDGKPFYAGDRISILDNNTINYFYEGNPYEAFKRIGIPSNESTDVEYRIILKNAFGEYSNNSMAKPTGKYSISTKVAPIFPTQQLKFTIGYARGFNQKTGIEYIQPPENQDGIPYFNPGAVLKLNFNILPSDQNDIYWTGTIEQKKNTIVSYEVGFKSNTANWVTIGLLPASTFSRVNSIYEGIFFSPKDVKWKEGAQGIIGLRAVDDTGLKSDFITSGTTSLILGRRQEAICAVTFRTKAEPSYLLDFVFTDYGGVDKSCNSLYDKCYLKYYYGHTAEEAASRKYAGTEGLVAYLPFSIRHTQLPAGFTFQERMYVQIELSITTGRYSSALESYNNIVTVLPMIINYEKAPTLSYRAHWVGVNSNNQDQNEVLKISSYKKEAASANRNIIHLTGERAEGSQIIPVNIYIDLDKGTVDGLIIDGGSW